MGRSLYAFLLCLIVAGCESISGLSDTTVQALDKLDKVIETKDDLEMQKESRIAIIKKELNGLDPDSPAYLTLRLDTYKRIYDEYLST